MTKPRLGEFGLIDAFVKAVGAPPSPRGPGDDAAVVRLRDGVVTCDAVVEGVHFTRPAFSLADVGHKALAVNLSDLAAMGARPSFFLCAVAAPALTLADVRALGAGMRPLVEGSGLQLVGGNFTRARELSVTVTAAGEAPQPLLRDGGRPGDVLYVSGLLGEARWGLELLRRGRRTPSLPVNRQKRPLPRLALGRLAARFASAAMDVSDGLVQDLTHLCEASQVKALLRCRALPIREELFKAVGDRALDWALQGGEDYELLLAVPLRSAQAFERACVREGQRVTRIGSFAAGAGVELEGGPIRRAKGHDHFRG